MKAYSSVLMKAALTAIALCTVFLAHVAHSQNNVSLKRLQAVRELVINPDDANWAVISPADLAVDARGRIYVLVNTDQTIRVFASNGTPIRRLGRKGSGPGEFSAASFLFVARDSLWVTEVTSSRVTSFPLAGGPGRTSVVRPKTSLSGTMFALASSGFLATTRDPLRPDWRPMTVHIDGTGKVLNTVLAAEPRIRRLVYNIVQEGVRNGSVFGSVNDLQPLLDLPIGNIDPNGNGVVRGVNNATASPSEYSLAAIGIQGDTTWRRAFHYSPIAVTDAHIRDIVEKLAVPSISNGIKIAADRKMIHDSLHISKHWPAFTALTIVLDRSIWLKEGGLPSPRQRYWRFSDSGVNSGILEMPSGFRLLRATATQIWGMSRDEDGNVLIERYRVQ